MKNLLFFAACLFFSTQTSYASNWIVTNTNDAGTGSLRGQIEQSSDGDTIRFDQSLIATGSATVVLDSMIVHDKFLTIIGMYNQTDTLYITSNGIDGAIRADLENTHYLNQKVVIDSLVIRNTSTNWQGGAISVFDGHYVVIRNSHFYNNHSDQSGGAIGCLHWDVSTTLEIDNCTFESNSSQNDGAAINVHSQNTTTINVTNSRFVNNDASGSGGAIRAWGYNFIADVTTVNCEFDGNTCQGNGGAILANSGFADAEVKVEYCTFVDNQCVGNGGAICIYGVSDPYINSYQSTFTQNIGGFGGALFCFNESNSMSTIADIKIINSTLYGNSATSSGGAVYADSYAWGPVSNEITVGSSIIANNGNVGIFSDGDPVVSQGYNFFGGTPSGTVATDMSAVSTVQLDLGPLQLNGGSTQTLMPGSSSVAIDAGNPSDPIDAQNTIIIGVRDAGASEFCSESTALMSVDACQSYMVPSGDEVYTISGTYNDTIPNIQGCDSVMTITLTINQIDTSITASGAMLTSNQSNATYQWVDCSNGNAPITNETNISFTPQSSGNYAVVIDDGICTDTSSCFNMSITGVEDFTNDAVTLYPNPSTGSFVVESNDVILSVEIIDYAGRTVALSQESTSQYNFNQLANGHYFVRVKTEKGMALKKLVVVK